LGFKPGPARGCRSVERGASHFSLTPCSLCWLQGCGWLHRALQWALLSSKSPVRAILCQFGACPSRRNDHFKKSSMSSVLNELRSCHRSGTWDTARCATSDMGATWDGATSNCRKSSDYLTAFRSLSKNHGAFSEPIGRSSVASIGSAVSPTGSSHECCLQLACTSRSSALTSRPFQDLILIV